MRKICLFWGMAALILVSTIGCFRGKQGVSVIGYRNQMVFLKKNLYYKVGALDGDWQHMSTRVKAAAFHNEKLKATISTDAFCGASFEDLPLNVLTNQLFAGTQRKNIERTQELTLDGRGALRTVSTGEVDGVKLKFDSVVLKKNNCTIDMVYIVPPSNYDAGVAAFEGFFGGFKLKPTE